MNFSIFARLKSALHFPIHTRYGWSVKNHHKFTTHHTLFLSSISQTLNGECGHKITKRRSTLANRRFTIFFG